MWGPVSFLERVRLRLLLDRNQKANQWLSPKASRHSISGYNLISKTVVEPPFGTAAAGLGPFMVMLHQPSQQKRRSIRSLITIDVFAALTGVGSRSHSLKTASLAWDSPEEPRSKWGLAVKRRDDLDHWRMRSESESCTYERLVFSNSPVRQGMSWDFA
jgi:hypothetical protein